MKQALAVLLLVGGLGAQTKPELLTSCMVTFNEGGTCFCAREGETPHPCKPAPKKPAEQKAVQPFNRIGDGGTIAAQTGSMKMAKRGWAVPICDLKTTPCESDPVDVPAIQVGFKLACESTTAMCVDHLVPIYSCADKKRVLLTSEDGVKHCIKF